MTRMESRADWTGYDPDVGGLDWSGPLVLFVVACIAILVLCEVSYYLCFEKERKHRE